MTRCRECPAGRLRVPRSGRASVRGENREGPETERFKVFSYDELMQRDKVSLDIFWLKDESLEDSANLPAPQILAQDIAENLEAALAQFNSIYESLNVD